MPEGSLKQLSVSTGSLPASHKIYVSGERHRDLRVPMREIEVAPSAKEPPVRVYDTSGPYTDPAVSIDIAAGLPALRDSWIRARGDVDGHRGVGIGTGRVVDTHRRLIRGGRDLDFAERHP